MINKRNRIRILVMILVFGMMVIGCNDGSNDNTTLSGTYTSDNYPYESFTFNGNNFTYRDTEPGYERTVTGTYTVTGDTVTLVAQGMGEVFFIVNSTTLRDSFGYLWKKNS